MGIDKIETLSMYTGFTYEYSFIFPPQSYTNYCVTQYVIIIVDENLYVFVFFLIWVTQTSSNKWSR